MNRRAKSHWLKNAFFTTLPYIQVFYSSAWNNGKEVPRWGVAEIQKMKMGDVIVVTNSPPIGHMRSQLTNYQVGIVLDVQAWSEKLY